MPTPRARPRTPKPPVPTEAAVRRWEVVIPGWRPATANQLLGCHWGKAARMKAHDRQLIAVYTVLAGVPKASGKRRLSLRITLPKGQRRWDIDALQKSCLDGAVHAGLLIDDNPKWAAWGGVEYIRGEGLSTVIVVEDVDT